MVCRRLKSGSEIGLYSATVASPKRSASRPSQKQLPWLFCVTAVRDSFPPDPLFREGYFQIHFCLSSTPASYQSFCFC